MSSGKMSVHSGIIEGSEEERYLEDLCEIRCETMEHPCRGCRFRYPYKTNKKRCCIFPTMPRDWKIYRGRK